MTEITNPGRISAPGSAANPEDALRGADRSLRVGDAERFRVLARFMYPFGIVAHAAMVVAFHALEQPELRLFNVLSVAMWSGGYALDKLGWVRTAYLVAMTEVVLYGLVGTLYLGTDTGLVSVFVYPAATLYFVPFLSSRARMRVIILLVVMVVGVVALSARIGVLSPIEPAYAAMFLATNLLIMVLGIALIMNAFSRAIHQAEDELQTANQKLAAFSHSVSEYLDPLLVQGLRDGKDLGPRSCYLTVFFADLAGSTRIGRQMNEQAFGDMLQEFVGRMQQVIKSYDGYLEDISGDGIFGYLGNFVSLGPKGDALHAVTAAIEMQAQLAALVPEFVDRYGLPETLKMRIGISSGEAQVGKTSGARAIYTANGDIVNLGAKLEQKLKDLREAGGILLSEATAELVKDRFDLVPHAVVIEGHGTTVYSLLEQSLGGAGQENLP